MDSPCELIIYSDSKSRSDSAATAVVQEAKRLEKKYNYYNKSSYLSQINARATDNLDLETKNILQRSKQYYRQTDAVFDITVATIKELFRSHSSLIEFEKERDFLLQFVGCEHFKIKKNRVIFDNNFTKIDLGGFVKEYAVDRSSQIIKKHKVRSALINFGGDIYAVSDKPNGEKFKIGIKDPRDRSRYVEFVEIKDQALTTSASYERNYTIQEQLFSHIISKDLSPNDMLSATVVSDSCVQSGVFSTSLMVNSSIKCSDRVILIKK